MSLGKTINPCAHFLHIALHSLQLKNTSETADKEKKNELLKLTPFAYSSFASSKPTCMLLRTTIP